MRAFKTVVLALLIAVSTTGCQKRLALVGPQPLDAPSTVTSTVDPSRGLTGTWTRIVGDLEVVVTFEPDGTGVAWVHVTAPNTPGLSQTYAFTYSLGDSVTIDFAEQADEAAWQTDEVFVVERMSAAAMRVRSVGDSEWVTSGLWVRAD